jgi:hypothetical protein
LSDGQRWSTLAIVGGKGDRPSLENRWWVDQGKAERGVPAERPPAQFGHRFFRTGDGYEQNAAQRRLTDLNLKWFDEANPPVGDFAVMALLEKERFPPKRYDKVRAALMVPPRGRGVLVDSGVSLRAIITADPRYERLVEVRFGEDNSFDAWVYGEWVREVCFRNFDEALRRVPPLVREYLTTGRAQFVH